MFGKHRETTISVKVAHTTPIRGWQLLILALGTLLLSQMAPAQKEVVNHEAKIIIDILNKNMPPYLDGKNSLSVSYSIEIYEINAKSHNLELQDDYKYELLFEGNFWKYSCKNAKMIYQDKVSKDNEILMAFDGINRKALITSGVKASERKPSLEGHISQEGNLHNRFNYFTFVNEIGDKMLLDYVRECPDSIKDVKFNTSEVAITIEEQGGLFRHRVSIDPAKNFAMKQCITFNQAQKITAQKDIELARVADGVWLPQGGILNVYDPERREIVRRVILRASTDQIKIKEKQPQSSWEVSFPNGTRVTDFTKGGISYTIGEVDEALVATLSDSRRLISQELLLSTNRDKPTSEPQTAGRPIQAVIVTQSRERVENHSSTYGRLLPVMIGFLLLVGAGGTRIIAKKLRGKKTDGKKP